MKRLKLWFWLSIIYFLKIQLLCQTVSYEMLVSSRNTHSVKKYDFQTGEYISDFISPGSGGLNTTQDVIKAHDGNILVSGRGNSNILLYDKISGNFLRPFTTGYTLDNPTKIAFGPDGNLYVSQWGTSNRKIVKFNGSSGEFINEFTESLNQPLGLTWDRSGNLYVACFGSGDIRKFDTAGNFLGVFTESGHLLGPAYIWFDGSGNLLVEDWTFGKVQKFNAETGIFESTLVSGLQNAEGYAYGPDDNLYICDWSQNVINKYSPDGKLINVFTNQGNLQAPNSILIRESTTIGITNLTTNAYIFSLEQNYPNPFNPTTRIKFSIPFTEFIILKIYNAEGREAAELINEELRSGSYELDWDAGGLSSGLYFYALTASKVNSSEKFTSTRKMVLLK